MMAHASPRRPRLPPPDDGIVVQQPVGALGGRFLHALGAVWPSEPGRAARGRTDARAGRVHGLAFDGRALCARVTGKREHRVCIGLTRFADDTWARAETALARSPAALAALRAGQISPVVESAFAAAGASLLPRVRGDVELSCTCTDDARPCRHIVAVALAVALTLDRDPTHLLKLRGRTGASLLAGLAAPTPPPSTTTAPATSTTTAPATMTTTAPAPLASTTTAPPTSSTTAPAPFATTTPRPPAAKGVPARPTMTVPLPARVRPTMTVARVPFEEFDRAPSVLPPTVALPTSARALSHRVDPATWTDPAALDAVLAPLYARAAAHARALLADVDA